MARCGKGMCILGCFMGLQVSISEENNLPVELNTQEFETVTRFWKTTHSSKDLVRFKSITDKWWALPFNGIYYGSLQIEKYDVMPDINAIFPYLD